MSLDHLSFSPSLIEVLSLIDPRDVTNCQLVSRRFDDVIKKNYLSMPRVIVNIRVRCLREGEVVGCKVIVKTFEKQNKDIFMIFEDWTMLLSCHHRDSVRRYYSEQGYETDDKPVSILSPNPGRSESVRLLFQLLFQRYHIRSLVFDYFDTANTDDAGGWLRIICQEFKKWRARCEAMLMELHHPDVQFLFGQFACASLHISKGINRSLQEQFDGIPRWDRQMFIRISPTRFTCFQPVICFLKRWANGFLERAECVYVVHKDYDGLHFRWSPDEVSQMLTESGLKCMQIDDFYFYFAHNTERRILLLEYPLQPTLITIQELDATTEEYFDDLWHQIEEVNR